MTAARKRDDFEGEQLVAARDSAISVLEGAESDLEWHRFHLAAAETEVSAAIAAVDAAKARQAEAEQKLADERANRDDLTKAVERAQVTLEAARGAVHTHYGPGSRR